MATNWITKFRACLLLSAYKTLKDKDGVTAGSCSASEESCEADTLENTAYKYNKSTLIAEENKESFEECFKTCSEVLINIYIDLLIFIFIMIDID